MKYDRLWERLIEYLNEWASAREVPGGIEVTHETAPGVSRTVEVVVSPAQWDDYVSTLHGTGDPRVTRLKQAVLDMPADVAFLVYDSYEWVPSDTPELPDDDFNPGPGVWVVTDEHGQVIDRFADHDERS